MIHVYGHSDEVLTADQFSLDEKINCIADTLDTEALIQGAVFKLFI